MITDEQLKKIMPKLSEAKGRELMPFLQAAMTEFGIDQPAREAAFLAQVAHESGQFRFMEEIWGPTDAQRRYEPASTLATSLGNTATGDGKRYKGRGPIQITGRANYRTFGGLLGVDLETNPETAATPPLAFRIAGLYWSKRGLNELADQASADAFKAITKRINGGINGLEDRKAFYAVARTVLGVPDVVVTRGAPSLPSTEDETPEPVFERGFEAIRLLSRAPTTRKPAARGKKKTARATGAKRKGAARQASPRSKAKPVTRRKRTAGGPKRAAGATKKARKVKSKKGPSRGKR